MASLHSSPRQNEPIAIVGSGCRFPGGASSPSKLWDLLRQPRDVLSEIPPSRFDVHGFYHPDSQFPGHTNVRHSYLLDDDVSLFDAQFFNITQAEAVAMDPQQRILLETVYEGLEAAGLTIEGLKGSNTGVYVGVMYVDYESVQFRDLQHIPKYLAIGTARSIVSNRVSYFFDWHGPSLTVDTACSSSLVAVHQAVQALRAGEVRVALAAGSNLLLGPEPYIHESKLNMLSPDGRSRMWDQDANGYARGDGVAAVVLKTLTAALADGDHIEGLIRETGVNQDGRSRGITMPSAAAQATLIRDTYTRAGLDLNSKADRCQYFEAHGTGTPAGDPVEAEAVQTAFFRHGVPAEETGQPPLFVGSIKTLIGHTESTAGLAGILKVVQAMKHGYIPPNLHLNRLNPTVRPFYDHLQIPQELIPWPQLPPGHCRRASVNSFGFGGTNAHVILESFQQPQDDTATQERTTSTSLTPFVFSAQSKQSLLASLTAHAEYLKGHPDTSAADLAWTLRSRRSRLPLRVSLPASSIEVLQSGLNELISNFQLAPRSATAGTKKTRLLGVFTGQGAQWARMGAELVETSEHAANILADLDDVLAQLPEQDRPSWSLRQELLAGPSSSKIETALVAQPLCTAVQIILVELLRLAGIQFSAVVGHSSGEIGAAFAAGQLSSRDAIRIAYYRGLHSRLAGGPDGVQGAMLAVGTTFEDAQELCNDEYFEGRIKVAASNSPSSVTLSGDKDAVDEIAEIFEDENKFVRHLRVDKAYHSHHMVPCAQAYLDSMESVSVRTECLQSSCTWVSSVYPDRPLDEPVKIDSSYWVDNLLSPVLFMQAVERAMSLGPFDGAIEVGPHPALKGPVRDTLQNLEVDMPYTGLLQRNSDAIRSISNALGYLWIYLDNLVIDFDRYESAMGGPTSYNFISDLPVYQWNHSQGYWHESNISKNLRQRSHPTHLLLGDLMPESSSHQLTWKGILRPQDLPWVHDHRIQGQTVFPAAGYAVTAMETAPFLAEKSPVRLVEIEDLIIHQAMVFGNDDQESGVEVRSVVSHINREDPKCIRAHFTYEACIGTQQIFHLVASAEISIQIGEPSPQTLPATGSLEPYMVDVPTELAYSALKDVGYGYTGPFKALSNLKRKLGKATGSLAVTVPASAKDVLAVHPAMLDAAFHSIILAFSYPRDGQLWSLHLPTRIQRIRINPSLCGQHWLDVGQVQFVASMLDVHETNGASGFKGDVEIHTSKGDYSAVQVEGLHVVPFTPAAPSDDQRLFYAMHWIDADPNADVPEIYRAAAEEKELALILERGSYFYLRQLEHQIPDGHPGRSDKYNAAYLDFASYTHKLVSEGKHRYAKKEWLNDTLEDIVVLTERFSDYPEIKAMHVVGEQMPRAIRGETTMLEHLMTNGLLGDYYAKAKSVTQGTEMLAETVVQIARRYPHGRILEVGAGTGGATREILKRIGDDLSAYTFTDVSAGFFNDAQAEFAPYEDRMTYSILDLEQDMPTQGFEKFSYDLIVASFVLHATKSIEQTLRRVRSLLKPGGYLVMYEVTNVDIIRGTALFGCLPGWWQGLEEGRTLGACVSESKWDAILRRTGFSGIDTMTPIQDALPLPNSVMVSQAVDDWVEFIREPLLARPSLFMGRSVVKDLFIVGGSTFRVSRLIEDIIKFIGVYCDSITRAETLEELDTAKVDQKATVLILEDLDHPVFKDITAERWDSLKKLFGSEKAILWVTQDRMVDNPFGNMAVGFARSALWEVPELCYQVIDFQDVHRIDPRILTEAVLRFQASRSVSEQSQRNTLWSVESEVIIKSDGRQMIPRLKPASDANNRYNSARRTITKDVQPQDWPVVASNLDGQYVLHEQSAPAKKLTGATTTICLKLSHSSLRAVRTVFGDAFVVLGSSTKNGARFLGLSDSVGSLADMPRSSMVPCAVEPQSDALLVALIAANLILPVLTESLAAGDVVVVHNAPLPIATLLDRHAALAEIRLVFTTESREIADQKNWTHIHRYSRQSELRSLLPAKISRCIDFTTIDGPSLMKSCLPSNSRVISALSLFPKNTDQLPFTQRHDSEVNEILKLAMKSALADLSAWQQDHTEFNRINIRDLAEKGDECDVLTVTEWNASSLSIAVQPVTAHFKSDRTYWLVGLSGDLGLSIADWMIGNGAKTLVISSRNPNIERAWLDKARRRGAVVQTMSCDLTDEVEVRKTYSEICTNLPPIAGVYQGAMLLSDVALRDMTLEQFTRVLRPKVEGSLNLDRLFGDEPLDFFVFFSSAATVAGNPGQANYTTANLFMSGLASQRRQRGLSASVVELGLIMGTGYITREKGDALTRPSFDRGLLTISESDVHQTLAEAINYGRPGSAAEWQLSTGLRRMPANAPNRPQWYSYPQFACLTERDAVDEINTSSTQTGPSIKQQLANATTKEDIETIITETFIAEMRKMLHLSDDYAITPSVRTDELGLDSLVAVRIRSWFLNNFQVNIPALRILKGASLRELVELAVEEVPEDLTPKITFDESLQPEGQEGSVSRSSSDRYSEQADIPTAPALETAASSVADEDDFKRHLDDDHAQNMEMTRTGDLSYTQSVFLFVHELLSDKATLNNTVMLHLSGEIRIHDLARAVRALGERHESLRTCIHQRDGRPCQGVLDSPSLTLEHKRILTKEDLFNEYTSLRHHVYDLSRGQTSRSILLSYSSRDHYLLMGSHHIVFDRASNDAVMADLEQLYNGLSPQSDVLQYLDYSNEQYEHYASGRWNEAIDFWRREFTTLPDSLSLHRSQLSERLPLERYASRILDYRINSQLSGKIRQVARKYRSTPFHFHLAAFKVLLHRFLGTKDVCIGIADSCRRDDYMRTGIGPFLNMLPLRMHASAEQPFIGALEDARQKSLSVLTNSIPLEVILNELRVSRQSTHTPLAQAFMNYAENNLEDGQSFLGCRMEMMKQDMAELPYDITFTVINNTTGDTRILLNVQESLYTEDDTQLIAHGYEDILREFANAPDKEIGDQWQFRQPVLQKALTLGRGPHFNSTWPETLVHQFQTFFPKVAQRLAVTDCDHVSVTYGKLSSQIDVIASELLRQKIEPGARVAVFQHPRVDWVASVLAILTIGAVYVPLDAGTPIARLSMIVSDCQPAAILIHGPTRDTINVLETPPNTPVIDLSSLSEVPTQPVPILARPDAPAIILYTSGSTGTPKGVVLRHSSLKHEFDHCATVYGLGEEDVILQQSAWSFDVSVTQIFLALGVGARLHMVSHLMRVDPLAMTELVKNEGITATYATPTEYKSWLRREHQQLLRTSSWHLALVAGEPVTESLFQLFRELDRSALRLFNVYGPTETTCGSTKTELMYGIPGFYQDTIPVGRASANECFYILDEKQNLQPIGQLGEIVIGGVGVAMGYLNNDKLTRTSFLPDPFAEEEYVKHDWKTMYRTGDLGYLQHDGTLVLKGRIGDDTEIKLNGVRVDLRDIEQTVLRAANGILADAVASLRSTLDGQIKFVLVHVVFSTEDLTTDRNHFLEILLSELPLPRTMRPSAIIPIDILPRTVAGKVDRRAVASLPIPRGLFHRAEEGPALSKGEIALRSLWESVIPEELVSLHQIGADSDFFTIGGSSMELIALQHKIREHLDISVPLLKLFQGSTLRSMARFLGMEGDLESQGQIDWATETALLPALEEISSASPSDINPVKTPPRVIVLTGATGFIGQHLLRALVGMEHVEKVICVAIRNLTQERREKLFSHMPKVVCYTGDLKLPALGLTEEEASEIFQEADAVIHNGADVSHLKTYASLRLANVASTQELARLCLPRKIPLHYVSTAGVTMYTTSDTYAEVSVRDAAPPADGRYGYVASKWVSEVYLENVHLRYSLPVYIHRPSSVIRPEADMKGENPEADVVQNMLEYSRRIQAVPAASGLSGIVDLVHPETVTNKAIRAVMSYGPESGDEVVYINESGDLELEVANIREYLAKETGKDIQERSLDDWIGQAQESGLSGAMATVFRATLGNGEKVMNLPRLLKR